MPELTITLTWPRFSGICRDRLRDGDKDGCYNAVRFMGEFILCDIEGCPRWHRNKEDE